jgi:hypothetical protein
MVESFRPRKFLGKGEKVSIDIINSEFWNKYNKTAKWQSLLFNVQAYHWLSASYSGYIAPLYINKIGSAILTNIERDIKKLKQIKTSLPIATNLGAEG